MTPAKPQILANMSNRQKVTAGIFAVILLFIIYQLWGMIGSSTPPPAPEPAKISTMSSTRPGGGAPMAPQQLTPQPAELSKQPQVISQREADLIKLQQETESKYLAAINELQMLKIEREIAETNKAIMAAKLETVTAEKGIVELLKPPAAITTSNYAQTLVTPVSSGTAVTPGTTGTLQQQQPGQVTQTPPPPAAVPAAPEVNYTVISVSQLQNRWNAVMGFQGNLYNVNIGDILPPDQSKVITIDKSGVILERNGIRKKVSMVPII